jgi:FkbM family methyltransferase
MTKLVERACIKLLKLLKTDLLAHAHVQIGVGHNTYVSGEEFVIEKVIVNALNRVPGIICDVGANVGDYAKLLRSAFPLATIYCFEPVPKNFEQLEKNTEDLNTNNILTALGSKTGVLKLYLGENNDDGAMATAYKDTLETFFPFVGQVNKTVETPVTTLDTFFKDKPRIDFLKIDVEGHELEVLKGAIELINDNRIDIIQFEFGEFNIFSKSFIFDFYQILSHYTLYRIMPQNKLTPMGNYNSSLEVFKYQNILAINNNLNYKN